MANLGLITYEVEIETGKVVSATDSATKQLDRLDDSMQSTDKSARELGGGFNKLAQAITGAISVAALVNEFRKAIAVTTEFNATISNLSALTGAVGKDLAEFRQAAIDIGGSTSLSATQAAEAMKLIGSASPELLKSAESLKSVTQQAVTLAEAAGSTLPEAAAALTGALNQFQLGADQAGRVINVLAAGAKEGASEINDTVAAMQNAGVVAAQAGLNFEQFNGAVQALAQGQIKGAEAGTGLRNVLTILNTQMKSELRPSVVGLSGALANLEKAGLDDTQMVKLFGRENITTAKVLLQFRGTLDSVTQAITGTSEAYKQAAINQDNLKGDIANLSSAFETLQIAIGDLSDSTLRDLTKQLTNVLGAIGSDQEGLKNFFDIAGTAALSFAAIITGRVVTGLLGYASSQLDAIQATMRATAEARTSATANLALAKSEYDSAQAALAQAKAIQAAGGTMRGAAADAALLAQAQARADGATANLNAATAASAGIANRATTAWRALQTVTGFLGGPAGVFLLAASAVYSFAQSTKTAKTDVDALTGSLDKLSFSQLGRASGQIKDEIRDLNKELSYALNNFNTLSKRPFESDDSFKQRQEDTRAALDDVNQALQTRKDRLAEISQQQKKLSEPAPQAATVDPVRADAPVAESTEDGQKAIKLLEQQRELLKKTGQARAELAAIQRLGDTATEKERLRAAELAGEIYKLEEAEKSLASTKKKEVTDADRLSKKANEDQKRGTEQNIDVFKALGVEFSKIGKSARALAMDQAELSLNEYATPEQIAQVRAMTGALYDLRDAQALGGQVDPFIGAKQGFEKQIADIKLIEDARVISKQRADELRLQSETAYQQQVMALEEERFRQASLGNEILMSSIDALASSGTQAISGLLSGTASLKDALGGIANTVFNAVIGAFVQMGVDWVKQQVIMAASAQATTAAQVGGISAVAAAQNTATATIASTTTTAAATTGTAVAGSMAPAAGLSSIASFGGAAVIGGAALLATMALAKSFSGRALGGPVQSDGMYRVNETGAPEIFNAANGRQYMMPNQRGEVVSNKDATSGGNGSGMSVNVNLIESGERGGQVEQNGEGGIDVFVAQIRNGGDAARVMESTYGLKRVGR